MNPERTPREQLEEDSRLLLRELETGGLFTFSFAYPEKRGLPSDDILLGYLVRARSLDELTDEQLLERLENQE